MRLYHGSNQLITKIDLSKCKPHKDFGRGFYMTGDYFRAVNVAMRAKDIMKSGTPQVAPYKFDKQNCPKDVKIKEFKGMTTEWLLFILDNRNKEIEYRHDYDIVIGPVADSHTDKVLGAYRKKVGAEYRNEENLKTLVNQLRFPGKKYIQYCFCTEKGIQQLKLDL